MPLTLAPFRYIFAISLLNYRHTLAMSAALMIDSRYISLSSPRVVVTLREDDDWVKDLLLSAR
jgi:hypothetical protein